MIPILYAPGTSDFTTQGLGELTDAINCIVEEERNGMFELEMDYPYDGVHFKDITHSAFIKAKSWDQGTPQLFRVYKITEPLNGQCTVYAEHISYQLNFIPVGPFTAGGATEALYKMKQNAYETCPFEFHSDVTTAGTYKQTVPQSIRERLGGVEGSVLDCFGGEYEWNNYDVYLRQSRGSDNGVVLRYGKNITDIQQEENISSCYTGICPYWTGISASNEMETVTIPENVIHTEYATNFPFQRTKVVDFSTSFATKPTVAQLRNAATSYINNNAIGTPRISIDVSFVNLWNSEEYKNVAPLERVKLCDTVSVEFEKLGISVKAKVTRTEYNVLLDRYNEIHLGDMRTSLAGTIKSDGDQIKSDLNNKPSVSVMQQEINRATDLLTGGQGGYIMFNRNQNGEPEEILIMDSADASQAKNVIRMNKNGIGYSAVGVEGPYTSAWVFDTNGQHFMADFITAGTMSANRVRGGVFEVGGNGLGADGTILVKDASGNTLITLDKNGITLSNGQKIKYTDISGTPTIPSKVSDLTNDSGYITNAASSLVPVYYKTSGSAPSAPSSKVTSTSTSSGVWTKTVPGYSDNYRIYTCLQTIYSDGSFTNSPVTEYVSSSVATEITKDTVTTSYVNALKVTATNISSTYFDGHVIRVGGGSGGGGWISVYDENGNEKIALSKYGLIFYKNDGSMGTVINSDSAFTDAIQATKISAKQLFYKQGSINYPGQNFSCRLKGTDGNYHILNFASGILYQVVDES